MKQTIKKIISIVAIVAMLCIATGCAAAGSSDGGAGSSISMIVMLVVFVGAFYFFLIRPENKKKKELAKMRDDLSVGDTITTIGGMVGKVVGIKDDLITFETGEDRVRVQIMKWGISTTGKAETQQ